MKKSNQNQVVRQPNLKPVPVSRPRPASPTVVVIEGPVFAPIIIKNGK